MIVMPDYVMIRVVEKEPEENGIILLGSDDSDPKAVVLAATETYDKGDTVLVYKNRDSTFYEDFEIIHKHDIICKCT